jgi:peptidoglycan/xylan/chitin deacetylase (PgdA/CDA1 family)
MITSLIFRISLILPALLIVGLPLTFFQPGWVIQTLANNSPSVLYVVDTQKPVVALTIDDGPDPVTTPKILNLLAKHNARATFFMIGDRIAGNEALITRTIAENHEVGNHMMYDEASIRLSPAEFEQRLLATSEILSKFTEVRWFRPGSGWYNRQMLSTLEKYGYQLVLGSVYPFDPQIPSSRVAVQNILWNIQPGSIIILHDNGDRGERTRVVLEAILPELSDRGYQVVTLSELVRFQENPAH